MVDHSSRYRHVFIIDDSLQKESTRVDIDEFVQVIYTALLDAAEKVKSFNNVRNIQLDFVDDYIEFFFVSDLTKEELDGANEASFHKEKLDYDLYLKLKQKFEGANAIS